MSSLPGPIRRFCGSCGVRLEGSPHPERCEFQQMVKTQRTGEFTDEVYLHLSSGLWNDGEPEPPRTVHALGTPEAVAAIHAWKAERDRWERLARQLGEALERCVLTRDLPRHREAVAAYRKVIA